MSDKKIIIETKNHIKANKKSISLIKYSKGLNHEVFLNASGNKYCVITGTGSCRDSEILIPPEIDGVNVTAIKQKAFYVF